MDRNEFITRNARKFVIDHLSHAGRYAQLIDGKTMWAAYCQCDGFGKMSRAWHDAYGFDWSHVRDSRPETFVEVAEYLTAAKWAAESFVAMCDKTLADCARCGITPEQYLAA